MAKGDHSRMQNQLDYQGGTAQNNLNNLRTNLTRQNQGLENRFNVAADRGNQDYGNLMGANAGYLNQVVGGPMHGFGSYGGYQDFANTGGYSPEDIQALRARSIAPLRAVYANAQNDINRQRSLQGNYSPNYTAAKAKMARELGYGISDANMNTEAALADQIRQGKLAGLGGMTNIDQALLNAETSRLGTGANILRGMGDLYGTAPGLASLYEKGLLDSSQQGLGVENLQQEQLRSILGGQNNVSQTPGNFQSAMGNLGSIFNLGSQAIGLGNLFDNPFSAGRGIDLNTTPYGPGY